MVRLPTFRIYPALKVFLGSGPPGSLSVLDQGGSSVREREPSMDRRLSRLLRHRTIVGGASLIGALLGAALALLITTEKFVAGASVTVPADVSGREWASPVEAYTPLLPSARVVDAVAAETGVSAETVLDGLAFEPGEALNSVDITWIGGDAAQAADIVASIARVGLVEYFDPALSSVALRAEPARAAVRDATATLEAKGWTPDDAEQVVLLRAAAAAVDAQAAIDQAAGAPAGAGDEADLAAQAREAFLLEAGTEARTALSGLESSLEANRPLLDLLDQAQAELAPIAAEEAAILSNRASSLEATRLLVSHEAPGGLSGNGVLAVALVSAVLHGIVALVALERGRTRRWIARLPSLASLSTPRRVARKPVLQPKAEVAAFDEIDLKPPTRVLPVVPALSEEGSRSEFALEWARWGDDEDDAFELAWVRFWGHGAEASVPDEVQIVFTTPDAAPRPLVPLSQGSNAPAPATTPDGDAAWPSVPWRSMSRHDLEPDPRRHGFEATSL